MKEWHLHCVERKTGDDSTKAFVAETQAEAVAAANSQGFAVGKLRNVVDLDPSPSVAPVLDSNGLSLVRRSDGLTQFGVLCLLCGVGVVAFAILMDTSVAGPRDTGFGADMPDRIQNIGLLERQVVLTICGSALCIMGAILFGLGRLGAELFEWGSRELREIGARSDERGR